MTASRQQSWWDLLQHWGVAMFFLGSCLPVTEYSGILTSLHFFPTWVLFKAVLWGSGNSSGEGNGNPLQYSCLENPKDRGAWQAAVRGITRIGHLYLLYLNSLLCWQTRAALVWGSYSTQTCIAAWTVSLPISFCFCSSSFSSFFFFFFFPSSSFWLHGMWYLILVLVPGMEPVPPALEAWSLNHSTTREVPPFHSS